MGKPVRDLTGQVFGFLTALELGTKTRPTSGAWWLCKCACGNEKSLPSSDLVMGKINSCGCKHQSLKSKSLQVHGLTKTRIHRIWCAMKTRCNNPNAANYENYGGRGIAVCERWFSFESFYADMGDCGESNSIDRIDNSGDYNPSNCKWSTKSEQANNTRANVFIEHAGIRLTRSQWEKKIGLGKTTLRGRLRSGMSLESALQPLGV